MREIVLDTETTGLDPTKGDRIIEIGCLELLNTIPTGRTFHVYIDPERDIPEEAFRVHGISSEFLAGKPVFAAICADFLEFVADAKLIAHNAEFDVRFLNAELGRLGFPAILAQSVIDTLALARRKFPGAANSLDALCARYGIDTSRRTKHGALLDAELLAEVYAELTGGRQTSLLLDAGTIAMGPAAGGLLDKRPEPLMPLHRADELERHRSFVATLGTNPIWFTYWQIQAAAE
jgi:DNA polymerase-3 subunit epsilon